MAISTMTDPSREAVPVSDMFATPNGHRYFQVDEPGHRLHGQWLVADDSAGRPWHTDDGNLVVDLNQEVSVGGRHCLLALITADGGRATTPMSPAEALMVAARLGLQIRVGEHHYRINEVI